MSKLRFASLLLVSLLLAGCGGGKMTSLRAYEGEPRGPLASVTAPIQLEVFEVSGVRVGTPAFGQDSYTVDLPAGRQQLLVQYVEQWSAGSGSELIRSQSMSLIHDFRPNTRYRLEYPAPAHHEQAQRFAREPRVTLVGDDGSRVEAKVRTGSQGLLGRASGNFRPEPVSQAPVFAPAVEGRALDQLKHWWEQASEAERQAFWQWMGSKLGR